MASTSPRADEAVVTLIAVMGIFASAMGRIGRPMGDIVAAADRVAAGDFDTRVVEHGPPWLRSVARAFNSMTSTLQSHDEQRRHLMADIAHELRTPLAVIQGRLKASWMACTNAMMLTLPNC